MSGSELDPALEQGVQFVRKARAAGKSDSAIYEALLKTGWRDEDAHRVLQASGAQRPSGPPAGSAQPLKRPPPEIEYPPVSAPPAGVAPVSKPLRPPAAVAKSQPLPPVQQPYPSGPAYPSPATPRPREHPSRSAENNSGTGGPAPSDVRAMGWCWGAFGLTLIWGLSNKVYISLLALTGFIPFVGWIVQLGVAIYLGISGHELAWQNRRFDSLQQFQDTMRAWNAWGLGLFILGLVLGVIGGIFGAMGG